MPHKPEDNAPNFREPEYLAQAQAFLRATPLIDGHNDLPYVIWSHPHAHGDVARWNADSLHPETDTDLPRLQAGQVAAQVLTAFLPTNTPNPKAARWQILGILHQLEALYPDKVTPILTPDDIKAAHAGGRIGLIKAIEGLVGLETLADLARFKAAGVRLITLCHNENLPFVESATDRPLPTPLSAFGVEIVREMTRLGLMIDLAHVSPRAQHAVMAATTAPVMISHANAFALCPHPRNAPDDVIRAIADRGGIIMATFVPPFLSAQAYNHVTPFMDGMGKAASGADHAAYDHAKAEADRFFLPRDGAEILADHLEYLRNLAGEDAIGIGSDFFGGPNPPGLRDAACFPHLFATLMRRGWKTPALEKLAGENFLRFWRAVAL